MTYHRQDKPWTERTGYAAADAASTDDIDRLMKRQAFHHSKHRPGRRTYAAWDWWPLGWPRWHARPYRHRSGTVGRHSRTGKASGRAFLGGNFLEMEGHVAYTLDVGACTGRFSVPDIVDSHAEPVKNLVTGAPHRAKVIFPSGFEFTEAEFGSSSTKATGPIPHDWAGRHAHLTIIDIGPYGPHRAAA
jgi:hypothetical protein